MNKCLFSIAMLALTLAPAATQAGPCRSGCSGEPFIRFLDDLRLIPWGAGERDPYEERMETERHDFTQSTVTVGRGVVQLESGYLYTYKDDGEEVEHAHAAPELLLRLGLSDDIEFRLRWNYGWQYFESEPDQDSAMDLIWSVKLQVTRQCGWIPESALEIRSTVPTGGESFTLGRVVAGFDYIYGWEVCEGWSLYGSTAYSPSGLGDFSLLPDEPQSDHFTEFSQSAAIGWEVTEKNSLYAEWFTIVSHGLEDNVTLAFFNIGIDHYFTDDFLIDLRFGVGLTDDSEDFFSGIGGGVRF